MRSTTFTEVARRAAIVAAMLVPAAGGAMADGAMAGEGPSLGCYERDYSDTHLADHPDQIVDRIVLDIYRPPDGGEDIFVKMAVWTANQGYVRKTGQGGQRFDQSLYCYQDGKAARCQVECDGGHFTVEHDDGEVLQFATGYLQAGEAEECGGAIDLAERPGQMVSYRLMRAPGATCEAAFAGTETTGKE